MRPMMRSQFSPASFSMASTVLGCTSHSRAVARTDVPSTRQCRMRTTVSLGRRTSVPKGFSRGSQDRLPHCWHLYRWTWLRPLPAFTVSLRHEWHVTVKSPVEFHSQKPDTGVDGPVRLRLCGSCPGGS